MRLVLTKDGVKIYRDATDYVLEDTREPVSILKRISPTAADVLAEARRVEVEER